METPRIVRVIEPIDPNRYEGPDARLRAFRFALIDRSASRFHRLAVSDVLTALERHRGEDDVPAPTKHALSEIVAHLSAGREVYQYELVVHDGEGHEEELEESDRAAAHLLSTADLVLGPRLVGEALGVPRNIVAEAITSDALTTVLSRRSGRVDTFVVLDERFDAWAAQHEHWMQGREVRRTRWHTRDDVLAAVSKGEVEGRAAQGDERAALSHPLFRLELRADASWARWVAAQQSACERAAIRRHQVWT